MKLPRPLFIFDVETTGLDIATDRICQFSFRLLDENGKLEDAKMRLVNPTIPIPPEATDIHGITDEMVKDEPTFKQLSRSLFDLVKGCDVAGYNIGRFDVPMLWEEFFHAGHIWDLSSTRIIDALDIWRKFEPRKLIDACRTFCPEKKFNEEGMHSADVDTLATQYVLEAQFDQMNWRSGWPDPDAPDALTEIAKLLAESITVQGEKMERLDLLGALAVRWDGEVVYTHQKVRGVPVKDDPGYGRWMLKQSFPENTKYHLLKALGE